MKRIIRYSTIIILMAGCFGETDCPPFPDYKLNWIPYQINQSIKFTDGLDTIDLTVNEFYKSGSYSFRNNCKCQCEANAYFKTEVDTIYDLKIEGFSNYYGNRTTYKYSFNSYGYSGEYYVIMHDDDFFLKIENKKFSIDPIEEFDNGNKIYKNVIKLELDTIDDNSLNWRKPQIWQMYIADSVGIIKFSDCKNNKIWRLTE